MDTRFMPHKTHLDDPAAFKDRDANFRRLKGHTWVHRSYLSCPGRLERLLGKTAVSLARSPCSLEPQRTQRTTENDKEAAAER